MSTLTPPGSEDGMALDGSSMKLMSSFEELRKEGYTPFILGPVYEYAGVQWDLVQKFAEEMSGEEVRDAEVKDGQLKVSTHKLETRAVHLRFEHVICGNCPEWSNTMNLMDAVSFPHFKKWVLGQQFVNKLERRFYIVRHYMAPILDPLKLSTKNQAEPTSIDVFSVCGMKASLVPVHSLGAHSEAKTFVEFKAAPPEEDVIKLGAAALKIMKES
jgi:hypothetical protein